MSIIDAFRDAADALRKIFQPTFVEQLSPFEKKIFNDYAFHQKNGADIFAVFRDAGKNEITVMGLTLENNESVKQCISRNTEGSWSCHEKIIIARIEKHRSAEDAFKCLWWRPGFFHSAEDFSKFADARKILPELLPKRDTKPNLHLIQGGRQESKVRLEP